MADIGAVLAKIAEVVGRGHQQNFNVKTLGADWDTDLMKTKADLESKRLAARQDEQQIAANERAAAEAGINQKAELSLASLDEGPPDPNVDPNADVAGTLARFRARKAAKASGLESQKAEADIRLTQANATKAEAVPDQKEQELLIRQQQLEQQIQRSRDQNEIANLRIQQGQTQLMLNQAKEERLARLGEDSPKVPGGVQEKFAVLGAERSALKDIEQRLKGPAAQRVLGPAMGRIAALQVGKLGGKGLNEDEQALIVSLERAFSQEAFSNGGKALTSVELGRFEKTAIQPSDTIGQAIVKLRERQKIIDRDMRRRYSYGSNLQKRQLKDGLAFDGIDISDLDGGDVPFTEPRGGGNPNAPANPPTLPGANAVGDGQAQQPKTPGAQAPRRRKFSELQ